jgi:hypothetical protein
MHMGSNYYYMLGVKGGSMVWQTFIFTIKNYTMSFLVGDFSSGTMRWCWEVLSNAIIVGTNAPCGYFKSFSHVVWFTIVF